MGQAFGEGNFRQLSDDLYFAGWDNRTLTTGEQTEFDAAGAPELGSGMRVSIEDVITDFIIAYVGEDKIFKRIKRTDVEQAARKAVQMFSYDVLRSDKRIEVELTDRLSLPLPQDFVGLIKLSTIDNAGHAHAILPSKNIVLADALNQDTTGEYVYDSITGQIETLSESQAQTRWQDEQLQGEIKRSAESYYYNQYDDYDYTYYNRVYGRRYGSDPTINNINGTYFFDNIRGQLVFDGTFSNGDIITLEYVSDGLDNGNELNAIYIHKFAELAISYWMMFQLALGRPSLAPLLKGYEIRAHAEINNTKIRLGGYRPHEITQLFRERAKWIKH